MGVTDVSGEDSASRGKGERGIPETLGVWKSGSEPVWGQAAREVWSLGKGVLRQGASLLRERQVEASNCPS